ncbi:protein GVQW3-like [Cryptotermes secundus]|uniref:protein GVQW3-like n=1 Tax=Cryptotermes secundus TaxID=105785 RepID=UPI001454D729|nr:protein GVQW3-like [Cryptotermes secundus]
MSVFERHRRFKEGRKDVQDDPRSGTDANVDRVRILVCSDRKLGVRLIAEFNMNRETVRQVIREDLGMRKFFAKMVPRILTDGQKQRQIRISSGLLCNAEMFDGVVTGNETWCF